MGQKMTWEEIKKEYPDQWVSLDQVERDDNGQVTSGVVTASGPDLGAVTEAAKKQRQGYTNHKFEYTGTVKSFLGVAKWTLGDAQVN